MPGSALKVVTLATAADRLGWDYRYETRLLAVGRIDGGVLDGDLVVVGSGDPSLVERDGTAGRVFADWADALKSQGITTIVGRIIGDDNAFDDEGLGPGWAWDDLADGFATSVGALQFNENAARLSVAPGAAPGAPASIAIAPPTTNLVVRNLLTTAAAGTPTTIDARRAPGSNVLELRGSIAAGSRTAARTVSVENPTLYFVTALRAALVTAGLEVRGEAVDIDDLADAPARDAATAVASYRSPPLSTLATTMMKASQNLYAETTFKTFGAALGTPSLEGARLAASTLLQSWGIDPAGLVQVDGSGLSRYNYVTADTLVSILTHVDRDPRLKGPYEATLPLGGRDGTLANRLAGTMAEGRVRAKTGTLANVRALAGYVDDADGEPLVFAIIGNNYGTMPQIALDAIDRIVVRLAEFRR